MCENMNGLKYFQGIVRVGLAQNGEQVCTEVQGTITVIYEMFCNGRPVCVVYSVSKVVLLLYFCGYMFNSWIKTLISSPDVWQSENTCKRINQRTTMLGEGKHLFDLISKQSTCKRPHTDWKKNSTYVHKQRSGWQIYH